LLLSDCPATLPLSQAGNRGGPYVSPPRSRGWCRGAPLLRGTVAALRHRAIRVWLERSRSTGNESEAVGGHVVGVRLLTGADHDMEDDPPQAGSTTTSPSVRCRRGCSDRAASAPLGRRASSSPCGGECEESPSRSRGPYCRALRWRTLAGLHFSFGTGLQTQWALKSPSCREGTRTGPLIGLELRELDLALSRSRRRGRSTWSTCGRAGWTQVPFSHPQQNGKKKKKGKGKRKRERGLGSSLVPSIKWDTVLGSSPRTRSASQLPELNPM